MADEMVWPLRAVSKDPTNLTKLDASGNVLTSSTDVVAAVAAAGIGGGGDFVAKTGDTMTGDLAVPSLTVDGNITSTGTAHSFADRSINVSAVDGAAPMYGSVEFNDCYADMLGTREFKAVSLEIGDYDDLDNSSFKLIGPSDINGPIYVQNQLRLQPTLTLISPSGGTDRNALSIVYTAMNGSAVLINSSSGAALNVGNNAYAINSPQAGLKSYHRGRLGLNVTNPAAQLEVSGDTTLRGELSVTGDITSTGTAHNFKPNSIPSSAVFGNVPRTVAAADPDPDQAGQMAWDDDFQIGRAHV